MVNNQVETVNKLIELVNISGNSITSSRRRIIAEIARQEAIIVRAEAQITKAESSTNTQDNTVQEQIDRELEDLKSKVAGLTSLSMLDLNPLALSTPPICGDGGSFVIPPGVKDTMNRITDNMLTNIKGSLLIDMAGLKFFSTPPRALLALSDPSELKKAHQMFLDMARDPYVKDCLALIGDPTHHLKHVAKGSGYLHELHPVTYNKYLHYGNFSTWNIKGDAGAVETLSNVDETTTLEIITGEETFEVEINPEC